MALSSLPASLSQVPRWLPMDLLVSGLPSRTTEGDLRRLFVRAAGGDSEDVCAVVLRGAATAVVRLRDQPVGERVLRELHGRPFRGGFRLTLRRIRTFKIFVGFVAEECVAGDLRALFERYGPVLECAKVRDYAFVHMVDGDDARKAIEHLNGTEVKGRKIVVELSRVHKGFKSSRKEEEEEEEEEEGRWGKKPAPSHRDGPSASFGAEYRPQPSAGRPKAYRDQRSPPRDEPPPRKSRFSAPSQAPSSAARTTSSYGAKPASSYEPRYEGRSARPSDTYRDSYGDGGGERAYGGAQPAPYSPPYEAEAAAYRKLQNSAAYKAQRPDALPARDRTPADSNRARPQQPAKVPTASSYRAPPGRDSPGRNGQPASFVGGSRSGTGSRRVPYERVRLSPPRAARSEYREYSPAPKQYESTLASVPLRYEQVRLSPPHLGREDLYQEAVASKLRYEADGSDFGQPYERVRLSPPRTRYGVKRSRFDE